MDKDTVIVTIASATYRPKVQALAKSLRRSGISASFHWVCLEKLGADSDIASLRYCDAIKYAGDVVQDFQWRSLKYDVVELGTSIKPDVLLQLLEEGWQHVIYLDPDMWITAPMEEVTASLGTADVLLTPHWIRPSEATVIEPADVSRVGIYNLGFIAVSNTENAKNCLTWWSSQTCTGCTRSQERGIFVDQRWADHFSALFERVAILRDARYNVAWWNMIGRSSVDATLYHFSGYDPVAHPKLTRHVTGMTISMISAIHADAVDRYRQALALEHSDKLHALAVESERHAMHRDVPYLLRLYARESNEQVAREDLLEPGESVLRWLVFRLRKIAIRDYEEAQSGKNRLDLMEWLSRPEVESLLESAALHRRVVEFARSEKSSPITKLSSIEPVRATVPLWERCECGAPKPGRFG
ncbi:MAG TPA: hypothetical protein VFU48_02725 [Nitrospira sp.]|nr:hypothetical protein [Nitrospira sp.]